MNRLVATAFVVALLGLVSGVRADDKGKANPTGTWKWTVQIGDQKREQTMKLKLEGDKLTGTIQRKDQEVPIEDAKFKDGEISFKVTRERKGEKVVTKYAGKLTGDTIKGKIEMNVMGEDRSFDWEAKRSKDS
jgi:hypothetical protein